MEHLDHDSNHEDGPQFDQEDLLLIREARQDPNKILTTRPIPLGYVSVACIIANRMIGTGIFRTPSTVMLGTESVGISLVFWVIGAIVSIAGILVFTEFGLTIPRYTFDMQKESVPRSGGEKNYLEYLLKRPKYLTTCLYAVPFILLGNMAGNGISFAEYFLQACGVEATNNAVRGLAIGVATFACLIHGFWRKLGIIINNVFGVVKVLMLIMIFIVGMLAAGGVFGEKAIADGSLSINKSFRDPSTDSYGYSTAFLAILFAFGGFNQANYVLGEIDQPQKKFRVTTISTVTVVAVLYILVNVAYMIVVPKDQQLKTDTTVALSFFQLTFGDEVANRVLSGFMAFSSLGNILVQTFTAARVKQEIAKEGILPFSKFFARNISFGRKLNSKPASGTSEATPIGALTLHWLFAILLILGSYNETPNTAYTLFVNLYSFTIDAFFGFCVGFGLLLWRLNNRTTHWSDKSRFGAITSLCAAAIFAIANFYPLVATWVPPNSAAFKGSIPWFVTGTVGFGLVALGGSYWATLCFVIPRVRGKRLEVDKEPVFHNEHGYWVMWHEIVSFSWEVI